MNSTETKRYSFNNLDSSKTNMNQEPPRTYLNSNINISSPYTKISTYKINGIEEILIEFEEDSISITKAVDGQKNTIQLPKNQTRALMEILQRELNYCPPVVYRYLDNTPQINGEPYCYTTAENKMEN